jgi:cytochrome c oxidase assembly protein subunit 15
VGGLVTTTDAGMAVPDWPSTYGYNLFLYPWQTWLLGPWDLFVEHGHRLLAATVGLLTIATVVSLWRHDSRVWIRRLGVAALALVVAQGVLGGMRVLLDERALAMIHGITGPLFFGTTVALAVFTSPTWLRGTKTTGNAVPHPQAFNLQSLAFLTVASIFLQIVLGAALRHVPVGAAPAMFATAVQFHLWLAGVLALEVVLLGWLAFWVARRCTPVRRLAVALVVLLTAQLALGIATWGVKYSVAQWVDPSSWLASYTIQAGSWLQTHIVTAHVALGSLLLATSLALALFAWRLVPVSERKSHPITRLLEVAV